MEKHKQSKLPHHHPGRRIDNLSEIYAGPEHEQSHDEEQAMIRLNHAREKVGAERSRNKDHGSREGRRDPHLVLKVGAIVVGVRSFSFSFGCATRGILLTYERCADRSFS